MESRGGGWRTAALRGLPGPRRPRLLLRQRVAVITIATAVAMVIARNPLAIHWVALMASPVRDASVALSRIIPQTAAAAT